MKNKQSFDEQMFPIIYKGKYYYEKDCDDVFLCFYSCRKALMDDMSVAITHRDRVYPDGDMEFD